ncbi:hypothetical protein NL676_036653 [Syzygium grande]|nr:hypothetical protein NL676_036653 [Syzygium grande]
MVAHSRRRERTLARILQNPEIKRTPFRSLQTPAIEPSALPSSHEPPASSSCRLTRSPAEPTEQAEKNQRSSWVSGLLARKNCRTTPAANSQLEDI